MSMKPTLPLPQQGAQAKSRRIAYTLFSYLVKWSIAAVVLVSASVLLSTLGTVHGKDLPEEYFSNGYPAILTLLDSEVFMGFIFFVTVAILIYVVYLMWQLHEVAVHQAAKMSSAHTQIVFALSLCGLFIDKTWWVLAIIIAFARWDVLANEISNIIRAGRQPLAQKED
ncbi:magnesium transporter [Vibrio aquaticus]|uniref:Magnesium transporter n=1 Tax=Vibrio aquaticus TaxID=2496559 RepID=A0A3S0MKZ2_9VIBR|nr:magnesium transporter [Vibrio aquaticus]RTZ17466.1 magnesium transporter [Vibrio aquaticus]